MNYAGGPYDERSARPREAGETPAPRSISSAPVTPSALPASCLAWADDHHGATDDGFEVELRFGAVSRRIVVTVRRAGEHDRVASGRTIDEARDVAAAMIRDARAG